jgi:hypothetical protein
MTKELPTRERIARLLSEEITEAKKVEVTVAELEEAVHGGERFRISAEVDGMTYFAAADDLYLSLARIAASYRQHRQGGAKTYLPALREGDAPAPDTLFALCGLIVQQGNQLMLQH